MLQAKIAHCSQDLTIASGKSISFEYSTSTPLVPETVLWDSPLFPQSINFDKHDSVLIRRVRVRSLFSGYWNGAILGRGGYNGFTGTVALNSVVDVDEWTDCNYVLPFNSDFLNVNTQIMLKEIANVTLKNETTEEMTTKWAFEVEVVYGVPVYE